ncbi:MAG TPA: ABC transporter substrate binding protein, partial [Geminicoccaceae bacterium]|nr:ABC transporter substrate binding protein [Geminicoccaceae bacterium]
DTVAEGLEAVTEVGAAHRLPVFAGDVNAVARGAIAALGFNYYDLGRQTGEVVVRVLAGADPGDIPVQGVQRTELYLNPDAALAMGVTIPPALLERAKVVIE